MQSGQEVQVLLKDSPRGEEVDVEGLSSESSSAVADILCRISSSIPLLLQVPSVMCAYSAATAGVVLEAASSSTSPCARPKAIQKGYISTTRVPQQHQHLCAPIKHPQSTSHRVLLGWAAARVIGNWQGLRLQGPLLRNVYENMLLLGRGRTRA